MDEDALLMIEGQLIVLTGFPVTSDALCLKSSSQYVPDPSLADRIDRLWVYDCWQRVSGGYRGVWSTRMRWWLERCVLLWRRLLLVTTSVATPTMRGQTSE